MPRHSFTFVVLAALAALTATCGRQAPSPTSPTGIVPGSTAAEDGVTLKATAPTPLSPINDVKLDSPPVLTASPATLKFSEGALQYRFQVFNEAGVLVHDSGVVSGTSYTVTTALDAEKRHTWRVRAELQGHTGPWSANGSFIAPAGAYLIGNELRDPLTNGRTIGMAFDVTFVPGVGVMLNGQSSYVEWTLQQTLEAGEFSVILTNMGEGDYPWKTKVMSMLQGDGVNVTDNLYRLTIDKRTLWADQGARVRYTIRVDDDSYEVKGGPQGWDSKQIYFWKFEWGNEFSRLRVYEGGVNGPLKEDLSTPYDDVYRPNPHVIRLGSVGGRGGDDTHPLVIARNVWVSSRPRPPFPGDNN
jgi:hypothetical protein